MATDPTTVLTLAGIGVPPYSARGLTQTLEPIDAAAHFERAIDGTLLDLSYTPMRLYKSTITGNDQQPPACDGVWPGQIVTVDCIVELNSASGRPAADSEDRQDGDWSFYRPQLQMMVTAFSISRDEWGAQVSWSMSLEEIGGDAGSSGP